MSSVMIDDFIALANGSFEEGKRVERERIVAMLRREASALLRHDARAVVLGLADSVERGDQ